MKVFLILAFLSLLFVACSPDKKFFDYDEIDYYKCDFAEEKLKEFYDDKPHTLLDSLKEGVLLGDLPKNETDTLFIESLAQMGYKKQKLDASKFQAIDKIFAEKKISETVGTACIYVYRDILIFKKKNKIIGTAKICLGCMDHQITGTKANTENFGQDGDYAKLERLLRE